MHCPRCGQPRDAGSTFCPYCGSALPQAVGEDVRDQPTLPIPTLSVVPAPVPEDEPVEDVIEQRREPAPGPSPSTSASTGFGLSTPAQRRSGSRSRLYVVGAIIAALALIAGAVVLQVQTRSHLHKTQAQLASTRSTLSLTRSTLDSTRGELKDTRRQLADTEAKRDQLRTELQGVRGSLHEAQGRLELQAGQIDTLKTCLSGVAIALDDVLNLDYSGAASALTSVQIPCQKAFDLL